MHIVQILPELNQGGVERGAVELNRELVKRGHQSTVISAGGTQAAEIERDGGRHITLDVCSKNPLTFPFRVHKLQKVLSQLQVSSFKFQVSGGSPLILHARSRVPAWLAWFANKSLKIPFITTVHGFNSVSKYSEIMTKGDTVICVSHPVKEYIQKNYGTPDGKITVIHRGIDPSEFDPQKLDHAWIDAFKTKYDLNGKFIVTSVGRITELKDYETFIRAVAACSAKIPDIKGVIVGGVRHDKQAYYERLQALVKELHAEEQIVFAGSHSRMPEIYSLSDVLVSCSKKPESFGRTLIEAMAMNTPVIAARHGGALDIIEEGRNSFLFAPGNANELADTIRRQIEIPRAGLREYVLRRFTLNGMVEKTINVYKTLACPIAPMTNNCKYKIHDPNESAGTMNEQSITPPIGGKRWPSILLILLALNAVIQVILRVSISDSLDLDEAEQVFFSQWLILGYGSQPPLYNWIQQLFFAVIPNQVLALSLFKHMLFLAIFALMYKTTRLLVKPPAAAVLAVAMLFLIPEFSFEAQRDLTHTVLAAFSGMWFFYSLVRIFLKSNAAKDFILLGLALGCCLLSKYNTLLMIVPMLVAAASIAELRKRLFVKQAWLSLLAGALMCAPHWYWLFNHLNDATANSIHKMDLAEAGSAIGTRLTGFKKMAGALFGVSGLLFFVVAVVFRRSPARKPTPAGFDLALTRLFIFYLTALLCLMLAFGVFGVGNFKARWLLPSLIFFPAIICFYLFQFRRITQRQVRLVLAIAAVVGLAVPIALGVRVAWAKPGHYKRLNEPYRELVQKFPASSNLLLITDQVRIAGNLKHHLPDNVSVVSADMAHLPVASHTCQTVVLAWREQYSSRNKSHGQIPAKLLAFAKDQTGIHMIEFEGMTTLFAPYKYGSEQQSLNLAWFNVD